MSDIESEGEIFYKAQQASIIDGRIKALASRLEIVEFDLFGALRRPIEGVHETVVSRVADLIGDLEGVGFRLGELEAKVKALAEQIDALRIRTAAEVVDPDHMDDMPYDVHPTLVGRVKSIEGFLTELNGRVVALEAKLADDGK